MTAKERHDLISSARNLRAEANRLMLQVAAFPPITRPFIRLVLRCLKAISERAEYEARADG